MLIMIHAQPGRRFWAVDMFATYASFYAILQLEMGY